MIFSKYYFLRQKIRKKQKIISCTIFYWFEGKVCLAWDYSLAIIILVFLPGHFVPKDVLSFSTSLKISMSIPPIA